MKHIIIFLLLTSAAFGQTTLFPTADALIDQQGEFFLPPTFHGGTPDVSLGSTGPGTIRRSLIRFDLSSLTGQTISSASLALTRDGGFGTWSNQTVSLFAVSTANAGWTEGAVAWAWANYPATHWAGSNGLGTAGTDYTNTVLGTATVNSTDAFGTVVTFDFTPAGVAALQSWVDTPASNAGLFLRASGLEAASLGNVQFRSRESFGTTVDPALTVTTVPEPTAINLFAAMCAFGLAARRFRVSHATKQTIRL